MILAEVMGSMLCHIRSFLRHPDKDHAINGLVATLSQFHAEIIVIFFYKKIFSKKKNNPITHLLSILILDSSSRVILC